MKINIWIQREEVWELNAWLKTSWDTKSGKSITFFHDKPVKQMDVVQVSISVNEYQKIIDNNEEVQQSIAEQLGWVQTTTIDAETSAQLQMLFGD
mgnify:CR=1 FL=1